VKNVCSLDSAKRQSGYSKLLIDDDGYQIVPFGKLRTDSPHFWYDGGVVIHGECPAKITLYEYLIVSFDTLTSGMTVAVFLR